MNIEYLSFTDKGQALAEYLASCLGGKAWRSGAPYKLKEWTDRAFPDDDALVYVGACGIAVRAIAPHVVSKASDPAVVVIDECGDFVIPVLSGHLGGANNLARKIAELTGAVPVVTTATDRNGKFAVDEWSKKQGAWIIEPHRIKLISSAVLKGDDVTVESPWDLAGDMPEGLKRFSPKAEGASDGAERPDIELDVFDKYSDAIHVVPRIAVLGIGCRKNTPEENIEECFAKFLEENHVFEKAITEAATIDIKKNEPGLLAFCGKHSWHLTDYTAEELNALDGDFTGSDFVKKITGVDSVCERSAAKKAGAGYKIVVRKFAREGVTMALALRDYRPDWSWKYE
ncbi:MAG: cobalamin biosynthesis protein [Eubacteriales bacterium]|nr:cobalamin biosynthesis protein [Eubacteriales bacterium]